MGIFSKKNTACPICGGELSGLFKTKLADGQALCRDCAERISLPKDMLKKADVELIKKNLAYRDKQAAMLAEMNIDYDFSYGGVHIKADDNLGYVAIFSSDLNCYRAPLVFKYDDIKGYQFYRIKKLVDDDTTSGKGASETLSAIFGSTNANDTYTVKLSIPGDEFWSNLELLFVATLPYHTKGFDSNISGIGYFFKCVARNEAFDPTVIN